VDKYEMFMKYLFLLFSLLLSILAFSSSLDTIISGVNSTSTALSSGSVFTGQAETTEARPGVLASVLTDQDGTLFMEFSPDARNWDSSISFEITANINEVHRLSTSKRYYRTRFQNSSTQNQTYLRLQTIFGPHQPLTSALNSQTQQDSDALIVKSVPQELLIAQGLFTGLSTVNKFGANADIDTGTIPEDVWEGGGTYTGFPNDNCETLTVSSASANDAAAGTGARTIRIIGLDCSYNVLSETVTLNGTSNVATTGMFRRAHTASIQSAGSAGVNAGIITVKHTTTTANVFLSMVAGRNQTNSSGYTVPAGYTAYMKRLHISIYQGTATAGAEGLIWTRSFEAPFRSRRPFLSISGDRLNDEIYGGLAFTEKSDLILRIINVTNNNTQVSAGYDLILVKN
jgi:hypothetical protein